MKRLLFSMLLLTGVTLSALELRRNMDGCVIQLPQSASPSAKFAAEELQNALKRTLNITAPIVTKTDETYSLRFQVGSDQTDQLPPDLPYDGFIIRTAGKNTIVLSGRDDERAPLADYYRANTGTLYAVYRFMREFLKIQMLWPGESGIIYPGSKQVNIPKLNIKDAPKLPIRTTYYGHGRRYSAAARAAAVRWGRYNGMGSSWKGWFNHASAQILGTGEFDRHPEYYALIDGKRRRPVSGRPRWKICHSNPELPAIFAAAGMKNPNGRDFFPVSPNDGENYCECKECLALDNGQIAKFDNLDDTRCVSGRVFTFAQRVAAVLDQQKAKQKIAVYAYSLHTDPPANIKRINDRIIVSVCKGINWNLVPSDKVKFDKLIKLWSKCAANILLRDYPGNSRGFSIYAYPQLVDSTIKDLYRNIDNFCGIDSCGDGHQDYALCGPTQFVTARLCWDPEADLEKLLNEYYLSGFPRSHRFIRKYFEMFEQKLIEIQKNGRNQFPGNLLTAQRIMSPDMISDGRRLLNAAKRTAAGDKAELERIKFIETGLEAAIISKNYYDSLIACNAIDGIKPPTPPTESDFKTAKENIEKWKKFIISHKDHPGIPTAPLAFTNGVTPWEQIFIANEISAKKRKFAASIPLAENWKFRICKENEISKLCQKNVDDSTWNSISTCDVWERQGFANYNGWAVYRKQISIPETWNAGQIILSLGAVDEDALVYCDGKLISSIKFDALSDPTGWLKERLIDLSKTVKPGKSYTIAIAVQDRSGNGGLWKPAALVLDRPNLYEGDLFAGVKNGTVSQKTISSNGGNRVKFNAFIQWAKPGRYRLHLVITPLAPGKDIEVNIFSRPEKKRFTLFDKKIIPATQFHEGKKSGSTIDFIIPPRSVGLNVNFFTAMKKFTIDQLEIYSIN